MASRCALDAKFEVRILNPQPHSLQNEGVFYRSVGLPAGGDVRIGDVVLVKPGETIPVEKKQGGAIIAATLNKTGLLKFEAAKVGKETARARKVSLR